jgi:hypothetical protein
MTHAYRQPYETHGTVRMYYAEGCRCPACRDASRAYEQDKRAKKRLRNECAVCPEPVAPGRMQCAVHLGRYTKRREATA